ncbi:MAG: PQQ-binding-like beta-propeller repeat protein, partial [Verrucomicrobia bacterium]|nr:PQQ-binding-like beta-propeller repeat protein [Verrucomicrobiota bacterium]
IIVGDNLYACFDNGSLTCLNARTGRIHYTERVGSGGAGFTSSPVSDGRNLYIASEVGNVYVIPATDKFVVLATNKLLETCMASPLISDGMLCYRTREQLVAIAQPARK